MLQRLLLLLLLLVGVVLHRRLLQRRLLLVRLLVLLLLRRRRRRMKMRGHRCRRVVMVLLLGSVGMVASLARGRRRGYGLPPVPWHVRSVRVPAHGMG